MSLAKPATSTWCQGPVPSPRGSQEPATVPRVRLKALGVGRQVWGSAVFGRPETKRRLEPPHSYTSLRGAQWNVGGLTQAKRIPSEKWLKEERAAWSVLVETHFSAPECEAFKLFSYSHFGLARSSKGGGAPILVQDGIGIIAGPRRAEGGLEMASLTLQLPDTSQLRIVAGYFPNGKKVSTETLALPSHDLADGIPTVVCLHHQREDVYNQGNACGHVTNVNCSSSAKTHCSRIKRQNTMTMHPRHHKPMRVPIDLDVTHATGRAQVALASPTTCKGNTQRRGCGVKIEHGQKEKTIAAVTKTLKCPHCPATFITEDTLRAHLWKIHDPHEMKKNHQSWIKSHVCEETPAHLLQCPGLEAIRTKHGIPSLEKPAVFFSRELAKMLCELFQLDDPCPTPPETKSEAPLLDDDRSPSLLFPDIVASSNSSGPRRLGAEKVNGRLLRKYSRSLEGHGTNDI